MTFAPDSLGRCATRSNATLSTVTFSTFALPPNQTCFNLNDTFVPNTSTPYWSISNAGGFDQTANYSRIWYQQVNLTGRLDAGSVAPLFLQLWPDRDCGEASDYISRPTIGTSCQSGESGECRTIPYSVASFNILNEIFVEQGRCLDFHREQNDGFAAKANGVAIAAAVSMGAILCYLL